MYNTVNNFNWCAMDVKELGKEVKVSWGFLVAVFLLGGIVVKVIDTKDYATQEIDGLRKDTERREAVE